MSNKECRWRKMLVLPREARLRIIVKSGELLTPLSDGLVGDYDPALCQKVFNISEAQAESVIEPDGMADDIQRKSVSVIGWCIVAHYDSEPENRNGHTRRQA